MKRHGALITPVRPYGARWGFDDYFTTGKRVQVRRATKSEAIQAHSDLSVLMANGRKDLATIKQTELAEFREWTKARESTVLVKTAVTQLLEEKRHDREAREKWLSILTHYLDRLADEFGDQRMIDVTTTDYNSLLRSLRLSPRTWNNNRSAFIELERWAIKRSYLPASHNQASEIKRMKIDPAELISYWRPNEFATILATANENDRLWYLLGRIRRHTNRRNHAALSGQGSIGMGRFQLARAHHSFTPAHIQDRRGAQRADIRSTRPMAATIQTKDRPMPANPIFSNRRRITRTTKIKNKRNANRHSYGIYRRAELRNLAQVADEMGTGIDRVRINYSRPIIPSELAAWKSILPITGESIVQFQSQESHNFSSSSDAIQASK
jgi:hypothetical protein